MSEMFLWYDDIVYSFPQVWYRQAEVASGSFTKMKNFEFLIIGNYYLYNTNQKWY